MEIELPAPYLVKRIQAIFIDLVLVFIIGGILGTQVLDRIDNVPDAWRGILFVVLFYLYEPVMVSFGGTLGHRILGMRVKSVQDPNRNIGLLFAIVRAIVKVVLGWLSLLTVSGSEHKRAIHDMVGGSVVLVWKEWQEIQSEPSND